MTFRALIAWQQHRIESATCSTAVDGTEAHLLALIEGWLPVIWIAVAVALAVIAGHLRSRLPVALGLCAVPALGWLFVEMFC